MSKINNFILCFLLCNSTLLSQNNFYDVDTIREIKIYFYESDWDNQLDSLYLLGENDRILADIIIDGNSYDSVGVRYKGFSSVSINRVKNPFNIKLDYTIADQDHQGIDKLKLSNVYQDPSFVREVLTYEIAANYLPSVKANYTNIFINDTLWGLYTNVQAVNKDFLNDYFGNKYNSFFKCNPENLDVSPGGENSNLSNSHGLDSLDYLPYYDIKSDYGWGDLLGLIDTLNNHLESIEKVLNVDRTLWMHALNYAIVNFDSYIGYAQNYYIYKNSTNQFNPILWDLNMSFGGFRLTDASSIFFNGFSIPQAQNMDPLIHHSQFSVSPRPLLRNLLLSERNRKMYIAHIRTIVQEHFINQNYFTRAQYLQNLISTSVQNDTNKFYTFNDFTNNLTQTVSLPTVDCPGITNLIDARAIFLSSFLGYSGEPTISNISYSPQNFSLGDDIYVNANVIDAEQVILKYRFGDNLIFSELEMFDDGNHNDGIASDGIYGAKISNCSNALDYYIYADNDSAGVFSPNRAAYEYYSIHNQILAGDLVINELMSNNNSIVSDNSGKFDDWIELFNPNSTAVSTKGLFLTDTIGILHKWELPNFSIPPLGYLIIWADEDGSQGDMHSNFKLSNLGEQLTLTNNDSLVIDSITYQTQLSDISFGRSPNGSGQFMMLTPTFNYNNDFPNSINDINDKLVFFPNPFSDILYVKDNDEIEVRSILGKLVYLASNVNRIQTSDWDAGIYFLHLRNKKITYKIIKL